MKYFLIWTWKSKQVDWFFVCLKQDVDVVYFNQQTHALCMRSHVQKHWKILKKYLSHHAHKRLMWDAYRKTKKKVCWSVINFFLRFSSWALHEPLVRMMKKVLFSWFSNVFYHFRPCECMSKHAFAGWNTQHVEPKDSTLQDNVFAWEVVFSLS